MKRPWFAAEPVDEGFFERAPQRLQGRFDVQRPAAEVWAELTADNPLAWCRLLQRIEWTSPRPFGVGTTRTAHAMRGANIIRERFFRWEEGRRKSFYVIEASTPMFRRLAEDYLVEPTTDTTCTFTWTIAYEPRLAARLATPLNNRILSTLFTDTRKHYS